MKICPICKTTYTNNYYFCPNDHNKLEKIIEQKEVTGKVLPDGSIQYNYINQNKPKCPTCGSENVEKISNADRAMFGLAFGLFSKTARSQFECKNCGYKF